MNKKGYTIVELAVAMAIFLFIIGGAIAIFISIVDSQRKILQEQQIVNQISYAQEYMSKAIRMAAADKVGDCLGEGLIYLLTHYYDGGQDFPYKGIKFLNQSNLDAGQPLCQEFYAELGEGGYWLLREKRGLGSPSPVDLVPLGAQVLDIKFLINGSGMAECSFSDPCGASVSDPLQPRVTIAFKIKMPGGEIRTFQTTVSQRNLNVK